jgi:hypothetical protein
LLKLIEPSEAKDLRQLIQRRAAFLEQFRISQIAWTKLVAIVMLDPLLQPIV